MSEEKTKVVALIGPQGAGKTSIAEALARRDRSVGYESFADPIRRMLAALMHCQPYKLKDGSLKDQSEPLLNGKSYRHAAQTLGTEWGRNNMGDDIWINDMQLRISEYVFPKFIVIDDARFKNEIDMLRENTDLLLIRILRDAVPEQSGGHSSEAYWRIPLVDYTLDNDDSLDEAVYRVNCVIKKKWG